MGGPPFGVSPPFIIFGGGGPLLFQIFSPPGGPRGAPFSPPPQGALSPRPLFPPPNLGGPPKKQGGFARMGGPKGGKRKPLFGEKCDAPRRRRFWVSSPFWAGAERAPGPWGPPPPPRGSPGPPGGPPGPPKVGPKTPTWGPGGPFAFFPRAPPGVFWEKPDSPGPRTRGFWGFFFSQRGGQAIPFHVGVFSPFSGLGGNGGASLRKKTRKTGGVKKNCF